MHTPTFGAETPMKSFHWTLLALVALAGTLGAYAVSGDFALQMSSASTVDVRLDCPDELADRLNLKLADLARVDKVLQAHSGDVASAQLFVDRSAVQDADQGSMVGYAFKLRTPDGNLIVSSNHAASPGGLDRAMAADIQRAIKDYLRMAEEHDLAGKGVVVENF